MKFWPLSPLTLKNLLVFPLRDRQSVSQALLITLVYLGLQLAFPPLALLVEAGYGMQAARRILSDHTAPSLPDLLDWKQIVKDGLLWWGVVLVYMLPGLVLFTVATAAGVMVAVKGGDAGIRLSSWVFLLGWVVSLTIAFLGAEAAHLAAVHALRKGAFAEAFHIGEWGAVLMQNLAAFEAAAVLRLLLAIGLLLAGLALALPAGFVCIGLPFIYGGGLIYLRVLSSAWVALLYRNGMEKVMAGRQ